MKAMEMNNTRINLHKSARKLSIHDLPDEVIQEILSRTPIQSLFQNRYVCRSWRRLINHTRLSQMHYTQSCRQINTTRSLLVHHGSQLLYIPTFGKKNMVELKNLPFKSWLPEFNLISSCNGFLCVADLDCYYRSIFICNPVIGEWFLVPDDDDSLWRSCNTLILGFGYEPKRNEYKVVKLFHHKDTKQWEVKMHRVGTLGRNSWKEVGNVKKVVHDCLGTSGVLVNGNLHWLGNLHDDNKVSIIVVSLADENLRDLLPVAVEDIVGEIREGYYLGELGGDLAVVDDSHGSHVNIWLMKEYGNGESLSSQYIFKKQSPTLAPSENRLRPLVLQNDGQILLQGNDGEFFFYDPGTNSSPNILFQIVPSPHFRLNSLRVVTHVGTLLSISQAIQTERM